MTSNLTTRVGALENDVKALRSDVAEINTGIAAILAKMEGSAPAKTVRKAPAKKATPAKAEKSAEFVTWLKDTAEQRAARKASNAEMAAWMRTKGLQPRGAAWEACKKGERRVATLRKLNADVA